MIDIKGLRIGNLVGRSLKLYHDNIFEVLEVGETMKIIQGSEINYFYYEDLEPIPLTEEWLVRLGFEKFRAESTEPWDGYRIKGFYLTWLPNAGMYVYALEGQQYDVEVKYVHTLQNIYYLLSEGNQELSLKEGKGE